MRTVSNLPPDRCYRDEDDLEAMRAMLMSARRHTGDWRYAHVGELAWSYFMVECHLDSREHVRLWHDHGELVGYAILGEDPSFDCQVLPEHEWTGIEAAAFEWTTERLDQLRRRDPQLWSGRLVTGARQDDSRRIAFLEQRGFRYSGEFAEVNMIRSLAEPIPVSMVPAGHEVRAVVGPADVADRAAAQREVWHPWTVGNVTDDDYRRFMRMPGYLADLDLIAVTPEGRIAAYANCWLDPTNLIGDIGPVGARTAYRRQGLTRAVLLEGLRRMRAYGMDRVCISTGVTNVAARQLYESIGFRVVNRWLDYQVEEE